MVHIYESCKICSGKIKKINSALNLVRCDSCELIFCNIIYTQEQIVEVYDQLYSDDKSHYKKHAQDEFKALLANNKKSIGHNRARLIGKYVLRSDCNSVLEIGSGIGLIGAYLRTKEENLDYLGIEIDKLAFNKSQELGLKALNGDFRLMSTLNRTFSVIMLWEVIEHLQDLKLFLELASKCLSPKGILMLSAPNYNRLLNYPERGKHQIFQDEPPIHLNFFTKKSAMKVFGLYGFETVQIKEKKIPYLQLTKLSFYRSVLKAMVGKFYGPTLYCVFTKND